MLNSFLYRALKSVFGTVEVENEGVEATIARDYTTGYTTSWRLSENGEHGEQYRVNCPFCTNRNGQHDNKHHLYISYLSYTRPVYKGEQLAVGGLLAHCFRGGCMSDPEKRSHLEALIHAGMASVGDGMATSAAITLSGEDETEARYTTSDSMTLEGIRTWVPDFRFCADGMDKDIAEYLYGRGLTDAQLAEFGIGWGEVRTPRTGRLLNGGVPWVVIPVVMNGKLCGVQARCPDKFVAENSIRYWIHPGMRKRSVVYNIDSAREFGVAVVCEGVFDVFNVGAPGVCCFGHTPSVTQQAILGTLDKGLIWLPDNENRPDLDTTAEASKLAAVFNSDGRFPLGAHVVKLPAKDAGEMSRQNIWATIISSVDAPMSAYIVKNILPKL